MNADLDRRADDDPETTQPVGRIAPHFEDGRAVVEVAGGGIEIDPPEGFVPASAPVEEPYEPVTVYFSFGHGQTDPDTGKDLLDHYVTIVGPSYEACVNAMFRSRYGDRWAFDYVAGSAKANEWIPQWTEHERIDLLASAD